MRSCMTVAAKNVSLRSKRRFRESIADVPRQERAGQDLRAEVERELALEVLQELLSE